MNQDRDKILRYVAVAAIVGLFALVWFHQYQARNETARLLAMVDGSNNSTVPNAARNPTAAATLSSLPPSRLDPTEREDLLKRNPFKIVEEPTKTQTSRTKSTTKLPPAANTRRTKAPPFKLLGTLVGNGAAWAVISDPAARTEAFYMVGNQVGPNATLVSVERSAATLSINGEQVRLEIDWSSTSSKAPQNVAAKNSRGTFSRPPPISATPPPAAPMTGDAITVKKDDLDKNFRNLAQLLTQMRVQPYFEKGKPAGFLVSSVRRDSFVERLGARSGDIIRAVNGEKIDSVQKAFKLYTAFKNNTSLQLAITRKGQPQTLTFRIE